MNHQDSGLQPERTALSWQRTTWSMLILSLLCLRGWLNGGSWLYCVCCGLLLTGIAGILFNIIKNKPAVVSLIITLCGCLLIIITLKSYLLPLTFLLRETVH